jgi:hypothetical protein
MLRRVVYLAVAAALVSALAGCAFSIIGFEQRASWRVAEERACMARRPQAYFIRQTQKVNGRGPCGIDYPLKVSALEGGTIGVGPDATIGCPITEALEIWMRYSVQPAALAYFGSPIVEIRQISAYYCRTRNNARGAELSEHGFGNALDIAGFKLADGRTIVVKSGWHGKQDERAFLREVLASACKSFKTVLGPGAKYHGDHFHLDLAHHNKSGTSRYCNPKPSVTPPERPPFEGERYAAIPGQPRYDLIHTASTAYAPATPVPPDLLELLAPPELDGEDAIGEDDLVTFWGRSVD